MISCRVCCRNRCRFFAGIVAVFAGIVAVFAADLECATCVDGSDAGIFRAFGADEGAEGIAGAIAEIVAVFAADLGMC
ncbi:MAG: hypothetical protein ACXWQ5_08860 [Ktedonobacterales bacterium]